MSTNGSHVDNVDAQSSTDIEGASTVNEKSSQEPQAAPSSSHPPPQDFGPKTPLTPIRRFLVFLGITVTLFLAALDQTIVTTTLPSVAKEFNNFADISWVGTAYLLTTTAVQPLYGVAADLAGRKRAMYVSIRSELHGASVVGMMRS